MEVLQFEHLQFESTKTSRTESIRQNRLTTLSGRSEKLLT